MTDNNLFVFPSAYIFTYSLPNHKEIKQDILPKILNEYDKNKHDECYRWNIGSKSNVTTNYSSMKESLLTNQQQKEIIWNPIDEMFATFYAPDSCFALTVDPPQKSKIVSYWWNVYNKGDYVELHNHSLTGLSGFYILDLPDEHENGTVFSYINDYPLSDILSVRELRFNTTHLKEGTVVIFPSALDHYVNPSEGRKVSISFNVHVS